MVFLSMQMCVEGFTFPARCQLQVFKKMTLFFGVPALTKQSKLLWSCVLQLIFLIGVAAKA